MDEPCSALDPTSTRVVEETITEIAQDVTIVIVTHNMQQAHRVSDQCAFFLAAHGTPGVIVEHGPDRRDLREPPGPAHLRLRERPLRLAPRRSPRPTGCTPRWRERARRRRRACSRPSSTHPDRPVALRAAGGDAGAMTAFISHTTIDCRNAYQLSEWWKPVLGYVDIDGDPNEQGHEECMIRDPRDRAPAALHRGAGGQVGQEPAAPRPPSPRRPPGRGARDPDRPRRHASSPTSAGSTAPAAAGWSSRTPRATSSASCAPRRRSPRHGREPAGGLRWTGAAT